MDSNFTDATYACLGQGCSVQDEFGISTTSLSALDSQCAANASGVGFISRQTTAEYTANPGTGDTIKIGDFYYQAMPTTVHCSNTNDTANQKQASYSQSFLDAVKGLKAVK